MNFLYIPGTQDSWIIWPERHFSWDLRCPCPVMAVQLCEWGRLQAEVKEGRLKNKQANENTRGRVVTPIRSFTEVLFCPRAFFQVFFLLPPFHAVQFCSLRNKDCGETEMLQIHLDTSQSLNFYVLSQFSCYCVIFRATCSCFLYWVGQKLHSGFSVTSFGKTRMKFLASRI